MKKGEKNKDRSPCDEIIEKAIIYILTIQSSGERGSGMAYLLDEVAIYLLEECQFPIEQVAIVFIYQRLKAFDIIIAKIFDRMR